MDRGNLLLLEPRLLFIDVHLGLECGLALPLDGRAIESVCVLLVVSMELSALYVLNQDLCFQEQRRKEGRNIKIVS